MRMIVNGGALVAKEKIESVGEWRKLALVTEMLLANESCRIALLLQQQRQRMTRGLQAAIRTWNAWGGQNELDSVTLLIAHRNKAGACWSARHAVCIKIRELDAIPSQPVDIWCANFTCTIAAGVGIPSVIGHDQKDIGLR